MTGSRRIGKCDPVSGMGTNGDQPLLEAEAVRLQSLLDLRGTPCPMNFVRTKLQLERLPLGTLLEVWLDGGEPIEQVPESLFTAGFRVERVEERQGFFALYVQRPHVAP